MEIKIIHVYGKLVLDLEKIKKDEEYPKQITVRDEWKPKKLPKVKNSTAIAREILEGSSNFKQ